MISDRVAGEVKTTLGWVKRYYAYKSPSVSCLAFWYPQQKPWTCNLILLA